eukprot:GHVT01089400.1.p1 GENE.GHVT01089400.1~~GHVT01089400.1.p1  ORF type:complete len:148 (+),score=0.79 GHVT01089400.1:437-880(+)
MKEVLDSLNLPENGRWKEGKQTLLTHFKSEGDDREKKYLQAIEIFKKNRNKLITSGNKFQITDTRLLFHSGASNAFEYLLDLENMLHSFENKEKDDERAKLTLLRPRLPADDITQILTEFQTHSLKYGLRKGDSPVYKALVEPSYGK